MEAVDKQLMKQISEVMLAATVSAEEVAGVSKEIALLLHSTEYNTLEVGGIVKMIC